MSGSLAKTIATDIFAQMAAYHEATPFAVASYATEYQRMFVSDLENMQPAGTPGNEMQVVIAPVGGDVERAGTGAGNAVDCTIQLGLLLEIMVETAEVDGEKVVTDPNIDAYEQFVDQLRIWLMGQPFAGVWWVSKTSAILGDHYNSHLMELGEFHVPILLDLFCHATAATTGAF